MSGLPRTRWTAPRHSGDHVPKGRYVTLVRKLGPRQTTVLFKIGWAGMFEIGFHVRWPNWNRWKFDRWIRIVASQGREDVHDRDYNVR
jgi:hypothetical protein